MNRLDSTRRAQVISALVEGNSIRATVRMTGVAKNTVVKLLAGMGTACVDFHDRTVRGLRSERIQADEIWGFCYAKKRNVPEEKKGVFGYGDVWTFTAIDADSKLIPSWLAGLRTIECATAFMQDLKSRLAQRVQLTTDGHGSYLRSVWEVFKRDIDYGMLMKIYAGKDRERGTVRYSPSHLVKAEKEIIRGNPDVKHISTSFVERSNLTMRMSMRRFTRLTNGFSKKVENLEAAVALHFTYYNFCRVHKTLKATPAQAAGLADHAWTLSELVGLLEEREKSN